MESTDRSRSPRKAASPRRGPGGQGLAGMLATLVLGLLGTLALGPQPGVADVVRVDITLREDVLGGRPFGDAGAYEKIVGRIYFAFDPRSPANAAIVDLSRAPVNADGRVEAWSDFMVLQPKDPSRRRGIAWLEVSNRGGKASLRYFNRAGRGASDPTVSDDFGDGLLMRQGLTVIWVGWQWDVPDDDRLVRLHGPLVRNDDGSSIQGWVRSDWVVDEPVDTLALGHRGHRPYLPALPLADLHILTVRDGRDGEREVVPRESWRFVEASTGMDTGRLANITVDGGFEAGRIYELVYMGSDPRVVGLGLAAIRDIISYSKYDLDSEFPTNLGIAFGVSQTGRFLRHFLYQGFNADEGGRKVFDGMLIHTAGAGRGSFNHRFAQASRDAHRYSAFFYPTDLFPFTSRAQRDPVTGREEGLLDALDPEFRPRVMVTNTGYEYWGRAASLIHTAVDGSADVEPVPTERLYHLAGGQHFVGAFPPDSAAVVQGTTGFSGNPVDFLFTLRALSVRLVEWVGNDVMPPPTRTPSVATGTLVRPTGVAFPAIPGVELPTRAHEAYRADYGPRFHSEGIVDNEPPRLGLTFTTLVPQVDGFGNELGGIRGLELRVPVATYTPWLLRQGYPGGNGEMRDFIGATYPLPLTEGAAEAQGDGRPSLQRMYGSREAYRLRLEAAAEDLVSEGFLLAEDVPRALERALALWSWVTGGDGAP
ncbi:MAG: hypothetical protein JSU98_02470 [Gemmatimonadales bacterium]|nr:MAG: hypothetical protein JSU98_02470 [Gemmatimonadales bacterium]